MSSSVLRQALRHTSQQRSVQLVRTTQTRSLGSAPPTPPFARNAAPTSKLVESHESIWDDGVAPEYTIDFDAQHVSSKEGLAWFFGGLSFFVGLYQVAKAVDMESLNPAVNRKHDLVIGKE